MAGSVIQQVNAVKPALLVDRSIIQKTTGQRAFIASKFIAQWEMVFRVLRVVDPSAQVP